MQQRSEQGARESRLRRLKGVAVTATAALGMLLWGVISGGVTAGTEPAATPTPQSVSQDTDDDTDFFGTQDTAPGLGQATTQPMTRTRGS
jgi:hypothetical protein